MRAVAKFTGDLCKAISRGAARERALPQRGLFTVDVIDESMEQGVFEGEHDMDEVEWEIDEPNTGGTS